MPAVPLLRTAHGDAKLWQASLLERLCQQHLCSGLLMGIPNYGRLAYCRGGASSTFAQDCSKGMPSYGRLAYWRGYASSTFAQGCLMRMPNLWQILGYGKVRASSYFVQGCFMGTRGTLLGLLYGNSSLVGYSHSQ